MTNVVRLALLVCDTPIPTVVSNHGDYPKIFNKFLRASYPKSDTDEPGFILDCYDVVDKQEYPPDDADIKGLLITGSAASAYENVEWINRLIDYVANVINTKPQVKVIGSCFGHQIVARAMGADCVPNDGKWEIGVTEVQLTDIGKVLFWKDTLNIQQMHRDHVPSVPPSFHLLGSTPTTPNQGMVRFLPATPSPPSPPPFLPTPSPSPTPEPTHPESFPLSSIQVLTLQGHPEFTTALASLIVTARSSNGVIDRATAQDFWSREAWKDDGVELIGKVIWGILGVDC